jgi:hypothetical protein
MHRCAPRSALVAQASCLWPTGVSPVDDSSTMTRQDARSTPQGPSRSVAKTLCYAPFSFRITNFNPDQTSLTAQTLMSTSPIGRAKSRIVSSVISLFIPELFFGQEIQIIPAGEILIRYDFSFAFSSVAEVVNRCTNSTPGFTRDSQVTSISDGNPRRER